MCGAEKAQSSSGMSNASYSDSSMGGDEKLWQMLTSFFGAQGKGGNFNEIKFDLKALKQAFQKSGGCMTPEVKWALQNLKEDLEELRGNQRGNGCHGQSGSSQDCDGDSDATPVSWQPPSYDNDDCHCDGNFRPINNRPDKPDCDGSDSSGGGRDCGTGSDGDTLMVDEAHGKGWGDPHFDKSGNLIVNGKPVNYKNFTTTGGAGDKDVNLATGKEKNGNLFKLTSDFQQTNGKKAGITTMRDVKVQSGSDKFELDAVDNKAYLNGRELTDGVYEFGSGGKITVSDGGKKTEVDTGNGQKLCITDKGNHAEFTYDFANLNLKSGMFKAAFDGDDKTDPAKADDFLVGDHANNNGNGYGNGGTEPVNYPGDGGRGYPQRDRDWAIHTCNHHIGRNPDNNQLVAVLTFVINQILQNDHGGGRDRRMIA